LKYLVLIIVWFILVSVCSLNDAAEGAVDKSGKYYCNLKNMDLEETIYKAAANKFNEEVDSYLSLNPSATYQQLRYNVINASSGTTESTYDIVIKSETCLLSNGINPLSIATPINLPSTNSYAPEFGMFLIRVADRYCITDSLLQNKIQIKNEVLPTTVLTVTISSIFLS